MKLVALFIALLFLLSYFAGMGQQKMQGVNAIVHDESYIAFYGATHCYGYHHAYHKCAQPRYAKEDKR